MHRLLALLIFLATAVHAQTYEVGARYWLSSGTRVSSHNAQGVDPTLGNPTSTLQEQQAEQAGQGVVDRSGRRSLGDEGTELHAVQAEGR